MKKMFLVNLTGWALAMSGLICFGGVWKIVSIGFRPDMMEGSVTALAVISLPFLVIGIMLIVGAFKILKYYKTVPLRKMISLISLENRGLFSKGRMMSEFSKLVYDCHHCGYCCRTTHVCNPDRSVRVSRCTHPKGPKEVLGRDSEQCPIPKRCPLERAGTTDMRWTDRCNFMC